MADLVLEDLRLLLAASSRENSIRLLQTELERRKCQARAAPQPPKPILLEKTATVAAPRFTTITRYAWDQGRKWVKVYVTLPGLEQICESGVRLAVQPRELCLEVEGLPPPASKTRLLVSPTFGALVPDECTYTRKPNSMLLLKLRKAGACARFVCVPVRARAFA